MTNELAVMGRKLDAGIVPILSEQTVARKLIPLNPKYNGMGLGLTSVKTRKYTSRSQAVINYKVQENIEDTVDIGGDILQIPVLQSDAVLDARAWEAFKLEKVPVDSDITTKLIEQVAVKEDEFMIRGWKAEGETSYEIPGMFEIAGNDVTADYALGTAGNALKAVGAAIALLKADNVRSLAWNLGLNPVDYTILDSSMISNVGSEYDLVLKKLNRGTGGIGGIIYESSYIPAGQGLVSPIATPANKRFFDYVEPQKTMHDLWYPDSEKTGPVAIRVLSTIGLEFKHLDGSGLCPAMCKLSDIDTST